MTKNNTISVNNISTGYGKNLVVDDVSMNVGDEESVAIIGPNGAGKSTVLKAITGYLPCWEGSITYKDNDITDTSVHELVDEQIGIVPQGRIIFPDMTVKEHFELGSWTISDEEYERNLEKVLDLFPRVEERWEQKASTMSGGEQQMVSLGRALITDPDLLVLDEPSLGLSPKLVAETFELINEIQDAGTSILMVEQNAVRALKNTDRTYVIEMGEVHSKEQVVNCWRVTKLSKCISAGSEISKPRLSFRIRRFTVISGCRLRFDRPRLRQPFRRSRLPERALRAYSPPSRFVRVGCVSVRHVTERTAY